MDVQQVQVASAPAPAMEAQNASSASTPINILVRPKQACTASPSEGDVVVCGRPDDEQFRLRPLPPPPPADGLFSRLLRVQLAPGVTFGFQQRGGFGLRAELGPGRKSDENAD